MQNVVRCSMTLQFFTGHHHLYLMVNCKQLSQLMVELTQDLMQDILVMIRCMTQLHHQNRQEIFVVHPHFPDRLLGQRSDLGPHQSFVSFLVLL